MISPANAASGSVSASGPIVAHKDFKQFDRVPKELQIRIFSYYNLSVTKKLTTMPSDIEFNRGFVSKKHEDILNQAHVLVERLYTAGIFSQLSRNFRQNFEQERKNLRLRIVTLISGIQVDYRGTKCLRECVDSGWYLKVLQIFFSHRPDALWNYATDKEKNEGFNRTIMHNAVMPNGHYLSVSFASFVIQMDRIFKLGLAQHKDCYQETPLVRARKGFNSRDKVTFPYVVQWEEIAPLLLSHSAPQRPSPSRPVPIEQSILVEPPKTQTHLLFLLYRLKRYRKTYLLDPSQEFFLNALKFHAFERYKTEFRIASLCFGN